MNDRMEQLNHAQVKATRAQDMLYAVTAQSHYRAMALFSARKTARTGTRRSKTPRRHFSSCLNEMEQAEPDRADFYDNLRSINEEYTASGRNVLTLFNNGDIEGATETHLDRRALHLAQARRPC